MLIYESGTIGAKPTRLPLSIGDGELADTADAVVSVPEIFAYWLQAGRVDVGFLGAAQIDRFGNINTTVVGPYDSPTVRLPGAGGAPEIAASARRTILTLRHNRRAFVQSLDFRTSVGHLDGGDSRARLGLPGLGPAAVITDLGVLRPHPVSRELVLTAVHPGRTVDEARAATGWPLRRGRARRGHGAADRRGAGRAAAAHLRRGGGWARCLTPSTTPRRATSSTTPRRATSSTTQRRATRPRRATSSTTPRPSGSSSGPVRWPASPTRSTRLGARRVMLVSGGPEAEHAQALAHALGERLATRWTDVVMHVPVEVAARAVAAARDHEVDLVVALGGGSATGMAKAVAKETSLPVLAVPTTYAGSEMTPIWGLTQAARKVTGRDPRVLPRVVVYDPTLTLSLPAGNLRGQRHERPRTLRRGALRAGGLAGDHPAGAGRRARARGVPPPRRARPRRPRGTL